MKGSTIICRFHFVKFEFVFLKDIGQPPFQDVLPLELKVCRSFKRDYLSKDMVIQIIKSYQRHGYASQ